MEGDLWATLLGQTFSLSGVFLELQQLKHQKSLKTPNHHPAGCFKHLPVDFSQLSGVSHARAALHGTHLVGAQQILLR